MSVKTAMAMLAGLVLVGVAGLLILFTGVPDAENDAVAEDAVARHELVRVHTPLPGAVIESPLRIEGEARGGWYFEASFPVTLLSEDGIVVARHYATADGEWMTRDFVPFSAEVIFSHPGEGDGWLVLERSNPSGLPEHDDELRIPVRFSAGETMEVAVYFNRRGVAECEETVAVSRTITRTRRPLRAALEHLLAGPSADEAERGHLSSLPAGVTIQRLVVRDGTAEVDLSPELEAGVAGSCRVRAIRSQLENTLLQFPAVDSVVLSIDGRIDDILQP